MVNVTAIVVAAGRGVRMGGTENKVFLPLRDKTVLAHTLLKFEQCSMIDEIILVTAEGEKERCREEIVEYYGLRKIVRMVSGGIRRQDSVHRGLKAVNEHSKIVVVHDGARPLFTPNLLQNCIDSAEKYRAAISAVQVKDTIKMVDRDGFIINTPAREVLWAIQTPQAFQYKLLWQAYAHGYENNLEVTDDASLVESMGIKVKIVPGEYENLKITTPEDMFLAEAILRRVKE